MLLPKQQDPPLCLLVLMSQRQHTTFRTHAEGKLLVLLSHQLHRLHPKPICCFKSELSLLPAALVALVSSRGQAVPPHSHFLLGPLIFVSREDLLCT